MQRCVSVCVCVRNVNMKKFTVTARFLIYPRHQPYHFPGSCAKSRTTSDCLYVRRTTLTFCKLVMNDKGLNSPPCRRRALRGSITLLPAPQRQRQPCALPLCLGYLLRVYYFTEGPVHKEEGNCYGIKRQVTMCF